MNNQPEPLTSKFEKTIDKILDSLEFPQEDRDQTKNTLSKSVFLDFLRNTSSVPENKKIIDESSSKNLNDYQEFKKAVEEIKGKLSNNGFDFGTNLKNSMEEKLNDFISEFEPKLPPEKVAELRKIVFDTHRS